MGLSRTPAVPDCSTMADQRVRPATPGGRTGRGAVAASVPFADMAAADLYVDREYEGGTAGNVSDDPLQRLLPVGNQGGFRYKGSPIKDDVRLIVLYTTGDEPAWPDTIDLFTGTLTYFGDNRQPGHELHATSRRGNEILRRMFDRAEGDASTRVLVPPVLVFSRGQRGRDVVFRGLAAPGSPWAAAGEDLVALWREADGKRFQNYRATFTLQSAERVSREWIKELLAGYPLGPACPTAWRRWVTSGRHTPLISERIDIRSRSDQLPADATGRRIISEIHSYFNLELNQAHRFEECAVEIWRSLAPATGEVDVTRPWRDGGRDAVGSYLLGPIADRIPVEFALEAKCYGLENSVGTREMSRLIARLRFRQFGVFVTTSYFGKQAYEEVRLDQHPVVLVAARDIVATLASSGLTTVGAVKDWLHSRFPAL